MARLKNQTGNAGMRAYLLASAEEFRERMHGTFR